MMYLLSVLWSCIILLLCLNSNYNGGLALSLPDSHTCVIGAGYSGLAVSRYLKEFGVNFTVFEASRYVGGTWRFDPHVGLDEDGTPVLTSMYKYLRTNTPRQTMEFGGFPFPASAPSYPTGTCFYKYLQSFVKHFDLMPNIHVRSFVTSVKWIDHHWELTYTQTDERINNTVSCDFVIIANGQYVRPLLPNFPGQDVFNGSIIHSHDYREPETYKGRRVLLVGAGPSGLDLAGQLHNITAKLFHSHHLVYNQPKFSEHYFKKPDVEAFTMDGVVFKDGTIEEVDDVIFCTGYEFYHPFLDKSCGLTVSGKFILPLHQNIVNIRHPSMSFIGVVNKVITRVMDAQAEYVASLIAGKFKLPSQEEMLKIWLAHVYKLQYQRKKIIDVNTVGSDMDQYFGNLTKEAGVTRVPPVLTEIRDFNAKNRLEDLLNYRDYDYEIVDSNNYKRWHNGGGNRAEECPIDL
ncbi:senecionine N-oxygenase-like [Vanessa atalanta]|uniref:senecionine N-oxygenase-like n=1 Tax=Vanessa atalanta TaxID=42275 RepID=UPI001FCCC8F6|nr:senecionine N-oxygenase-like [Vanessa atalanta]